MTAPRRIAIQTTRRTWQLGEWAGEERGLCLYALRARRFRSFREVQTWVRRRRTKKEVRP